VLCHFRELRAKVSSLSVKVEKLGKLDSKLKSALYSCQTLDDVEHLVCWSLYLVALCFCLEAFTAIYLDTFLQFSLP